MFHVDIVSLSLCLPFFQPLDSNSSFPGVCSTALQEALIVTRLQGKKENSILLELENLTSLLVIEYAHIHVKVDAPMSTAFTSFYSRKNISFGEIYKV